MCPGEAEKVAAAGLYVASDEYRFLVLSNPGSTPLRGRSNIFVAQGESFPAVAVLFVLSYKLQSLARRPSRLFHPGIRRILAAAEKPNLYTGPTRRIFGSLDT